MVIPPLSATSCKQASKQAMLESDAASEEENITALLTEFTVKKGDEVCINLCD